MAETISAIPKDAYFELVLSFPLRPIRTRSAHQRAIAVLRSLSQKRGSAVRDYKSVLGSLIADYERSANLHLDTSGVTAATVVMQLLEDRGMSVNALAKVLGISQSSLSEMLNGKRGWSKPAIIRITSYFGLQAALFLR